MEYRLYRIKGSLSGDEEDYVVGMDKSDALSHFIRGLGEGYIETEDSDKITIEMTDMNGLDISPKALEAILRARQVS